MVPEGTPIGGHFDGTLVPIRLDTYFMPNWGTNAVQCGLVEIIEEQVESVGLPARRNDDCSAFADVVSPTNAADYALSGTLKNFTQNSFNSPRRVDSEVLIEWEVLRTVDRQVVYRQTAYGQSRVEGPNAQAAGIALAGAIVESLRRVLADPTFRSATRRPAGEAQASPASAAGVAESPSAATWRYSSVDPTELIEILPEQQNPTPQKSAVPGVLAATATLVGERATGSGFMISADGLMITNYHVVENNPRLRARFGGGRESAVFLVRYDASADVALLEVADCAPCRTVSIAPNEPEIGASVLVVGSPHGLSNSLSRGIVSGHRLSQGITYIQTDAAANPGSSGGPLVSVESGKVIGVVTSKVPQAEGLAFAASIQDAMRVLGLRYVQPTERRGR